MTKNVTSFSGFCIGAIALYGKDTAALLSNATPDAISNVGAGSPNLLLYV